MLQLRRFVYLMRVENPADPEFNIGLATTEQVAGLPKTNILVAGWDVLRDDGLLYAEALRRAG